MSSAPGSSAVGSPSAGVRRAVGVLAAVVVPYVIALVLWVLASPRSELMSVGEGRGRMLPDAGADGGSQFVMAVVLFGFASLCAVLVLWSRVPGLRRPAGVAVLALVPGGACAATAAVATSLAGVLAAPPEDAPFGAVVRRQPVLGELFIDPVVLGGSGPSWDALPSGAGWLVWGAMIALLTVAALTHFSPWPDLVGEESRTDR